MLLREVRIETKGEIGPLVCHVTRQYVSDRILAEGKERTALVVDAKEFVLKHSDSAATADLLEHLAAHPDQCTITLHLFSEGNVYATDRHGYQFFNEADGTL